MLLRYEAKTKEQIKDILSLENKIFGEEKALTEEKLTKLFDEEMLYQFVYLQEGKNPIGVIAYKPLKEEAEIVSFGLIKSKRKSQLGSNILREVITLIKSNELYNVSIKIDLDNEAALAIFEKFGFNKKDENKKDVIMTSSIWKGEDE